MKIVQRSLRLILLAACAIGAGPNPRAGEFSATATVTTKDGTRSMGFNLAVTNPMAMEDTTPLKELLARGGQQAALNAIRGGGRGRIKLGGFEYPVDLVVYEKTSDGDRYYVVTARSMQYDEIVDGRESVNHPFTVFVVNVPGFGTGDGRIYTKAALSV
ncbi:MAG TPA: hypothetical protein VGG65_05545, partial [Thermoanaerobaculia bacterium]